MGYSHSGKQTGACWGRLVQLLHSGMFTISLTHHLVLIKCFFNNPNYYSCSASHHTHTYMCHVPFSVCLSTETPVSVFEKQSPSQHMEPESLLFYDLVPPPACY